MQFQPSRTSSRSEYGLFGLTQASKQRKRDRKLRVAGRRLTNYEECIEAGKGESKCEKHKRRGERKLDKARSLDQKIEAKGKGQDRKSRQQQFGRQRAGTLGMSEEEIAEAEAAGTLPSARRSGGMMPAGGGGSEEEEYYDDEELAVEPAGGGGGGLLIGFAALALLGGGFAFYKMRQS